MNFRRLLLLFLIASLAPAASAQLKRSTPSSGGDASIKGIVLLPNGSPVNEPVKVTLKVLRGDQATTYTDRDGRFQFLHVAGGDYTVEAEADRSRDRFEITSERITVRINAPNFLTLSLKEKGKAPGPKRDKTVSVAMLDQKVPPAAKHEFDNATELARAGKSDESIAALQRAIGIYPDYLMALNDLGAQLLEAGRLDEALVVLKKATQVDPNSFNPQLNLGIVLVQKKMFGDALVALDHALSAEPSAPAAHLYAGMAASGGNDLARAEREFKTAHDLGGSSFAVALVYLARLEVKQGHKQQAIEALQLYLQEDPAGPNSAVAKKMLADLQAK
ncbi:MAG TPA: tetratricopeptide repeat protein [Pyrinomonadaceae bacterium]|nr:tetratricopeptide repeat protein [Pyrinomonadaceae bacterium]